MSANERRGPRLAAIGRILIVAGGLLGAASAGAVIIPFSTTFELEARPSAFDSATVQNLQRSSTLSLPRFDASLGTLQSVALDFDSEWSASLQVNGSDTNGETRFGF